MHRGYVEMWTFGEMDEIALPCTYMYVCVLGARVSLAEIVMCSICCHISGYQTLGEEYVNLVQVDSSLRQLPSQMVRTEIFSTVSEE